MGKGSGERRLAGRAAETDAAARRFLLSLYDDVREGKDVHGQSRYDTDWEVGWPVSPGLPTGGCEQKLWDKRNIRLDGWTPGKDALMVTLSDKHRANPPPLLLKVCMSYNRPDYPLFYFYLLALDNLPAAGWKRKKLEWDGTPGMFTERFTNYLGVGADRLVAQSPRGENPHWVPPPPGADNAADNMPQIMTAEPGPCVDSLGRPIPDMADWMPAFRQDAGEAAFGRGEETF